MSERSSIFSFCLSDDGQDVSIRPEGTATGHFDTGFLDFSVFKHATLQLQQL